MAAASIGKPGGTPQRPAVFFSDPAEWRAWLEVHHDRESELWMGLYNKHVPDRGLTWHEAVVEALCFGWIDSRAERIDLDSRRQRWTPRRPNSMWSAVNVASVERLIAEGRMRPAGLAAFERRRADRTGTYSFEQGDVVLASEAESRLRANPAAAAFWDSATPSYRKLCTHWVSSAKREETRENRLGQLIDDCANGRLIKSQRYGITPAWVARAAAAAEDAGGC
ncbi:MAG: YdeI/OmpD-associated family protein [Actinomycetales bacterium]